MWWCRASALRFFLIKLNSTLTPEMYRDAIESCARNAACDRIYTLNVRHFQQLAPDLADRIGAPSSFL